MHHNTRDSRKKIRSIQCGTKIVSGENFEDQGKAETRKKRKMVPETKDIMATLNLHAA